ncbi:MAG: type II secretion system F family protein [Candidatus Diapherotrites archaeon]
MAAKKEKKEFSPPSRMHEATSGVYASVGRLLPHKWVESFERELAYVGINVEGKKFVGFLIVFGLLLSILVAINLQTFFQLPALPVFAFCFLLVIAGAYIWLSITSESKGKFVEKILPDVLQLIASNIKAGLTTERAFIVSARPEFGPLEEELKIASRKILTGERMEVALQDMTSRIRSKTFERTIWLINRGISSGGQIADLLIQLSDDLREQNALQEEARANISVYVLLILVSGAVFAPAMFGISSFITQILNKRIASVGSTPFGMGLSNPHNIAQVQQQLASAPTDKVTISTDFIVLFAMCALFVTVFFSCLVIGIINAGNEKQGLRYLFPLVILAFAIFFIVRILFTGAFAQLV